MAKGNIEWEHTPEDGLVLRFKPSLLGLDTTEVRQHATAARKELLLTLRSLVDIAIKRTEAKESKNEKRGTKIEVE